jgi:hypothetical protein
VQRGASHPLAICFRNLTPDFTWNSHHYRSRRHFGSLGHDSANGNETSSADLGSVHHNRSHPNHTIIFNRSPVNNGCVPNRDSIAKNTRKSRIGVQYTQVLHIRLVTNPNHFRVSAHNRVEPDTRFRTDCNVTQDNRAASDRRCRINEIVAELSLA